jgi:hypothetical protein
MSNISLSVNEILILIFLNVYIDEQTCELRFGSTGLSASQVRFGLFDLFYYNSSLI